MTTNETKSTKKEIDKMADDLSETCRELVGRVIQKYTRSIVEELGNQLQGMKDAYNGAREDLSLAKKRITELEQQLSEYKLMSNAYTYKEKCEELEQQRDELLAALKKYGRHEGDCIWWSFEDNGICRCGLDKALAKVTK